MNCICDNCGWNGSAEALQPIQDFQERMGTASECAASYGIVLMPEGECPECGCLAYFPHHEKVWIALRHFFDEVAKGYTPEGRIPFRGDMAGIALFHAAQAARTEAQPERPPQDGDLLDKGGAAPV